MPVHILTGLLPWLLFNIILLFTGVSGSELTVYSSAGEHVSLPSNLHGSFNCSSITWNWNSGRSEGTIELVAHGVVKAKNQQIARRLEVGTNCSLHINNITTADTGGYTCRLYHNRNNYTDVSVIKLSILNISASSPVTDLTSSSTVTLVCKLHSPGSCGKSIRVSWVNETGAPLQGNRHKLSESECSSSLTVTLEHSDRNMTWRCQLTVEGKQKASHSYTTIFPGVIGSELTVYSSAGEHVSLPCNHHGSFNCSSITWMRSSVGSQESIELVTNGVVRDENQQIARRLRVGTDCSLHINDPTTADTGRYSCRLYHNSNNYTDVSVYLSLLNISVSPSSPVTYLTIGSTVSGSEPTVYSSAGELVSHSYTTIFPDKITRDVWIGSGVAICVAVVLIVILIMICRRRAVQRKMAYNHVSQSHTVIDQNKGESEDTVTYAVVNPSASGKRKQDQETAVLETEYAIIKTLQYSNKP